jgi:hypothetical protein
VAKVAGFETASEIVNSATAPENFRQLLRRNNFELFKGALARLLVQSPPSELSRMTEAIALHVVVSNFDYQLGS